jgi:hypothetical protein
MKNIFQQIKVERDQGVYCVRLVHDRMEESDILRFADEMVGLVDDPDCRKLTLSLGPGRIHCLYSVFLAKLVMIRRRLTEKGGCFAICDATPETIEVFEACRLKDYFDFRPDRASAVAALAAGQ